MWGERCREASLYPDYGSNMHRLTILAAFIYIIGSSFAQAQALVGEAFVVPIEKELSDYALVKVDPKYSVLDYEALMSSRVFIRNSLNSSWPDDNFTLQKNTETLVNDLAAFNKKESFTFHVVNRARDQILGCVYITAPFNGKFDASVFVWVSDKYLSTSLFPNLKGEIKHWVKSNWPFKKVDYSLNEP